MKWENISQNVNCKQLDYKLLTREPVECMEGERTDKKRRSHEALWTVLQTAQTTKTPITEPNVRQTHEKTLLIQAISSTIFLLIYEIGYVATEQFSVSTCYRDSLK